MTIPVAEPKRKARRLPRLLRLLRAVVLLLVVSFVLLVAIVTLFPDFAAQNVDRLRNLIGDQAVADLETIVLNAQDSAQQLVYQLGLAQPAAPFAPASPPPVIAMLPETAPTLTHQQPTLPLTATPSRTATAVRSKTSAVTAIIITAITRSPAGVQVITATRTPSATVTAIAPPVTMTLTVSPVDTRFPTGSPSATGVPSATDAPVVTTAASVTDAPTAALLTDSATVSPTGNPSVSATDSPTMISAPASNNASAWQLAALTPFGKLAGEGQWSPYLTVPSANGPVVVAYRAFLQPDPQRPYALPAVVAINLQATRLHFMLGTIDPSASTPQPSPLRPGVIPAADAQPGVLLATFNGGFKARHGHYGAMANGVIALPPLDGVATVGIYNDGTVQVGEWGRTITDSPKLVAWRQNVKLLLENGQIAAAASAKTVQWGATIQGSTITWRSALGISADGHTLYYIGGPHLDVPALARTIARTTAASAMQLDVNDFWVNFAAIRTDGQQLFAEPLLPSMTQKVDRYLKVSTADFFYVTAATAAATAP